ncbi:hypothetical protein GCM10027347_40040 [Larkinella harenae]
MRKVYCIFLGLLLSPFITSKGLAQQTDNAAYWISPGLGWASFPSGMIALGYEPASNNKVIISRFSVSGEMMQNVEPGIKVKELGLLYGVKAGHFRFAAGLSAVWGNNRGQYISTDPDPLIGTGRRYDYLGYTTVGLPGEIRYLTALKNVGVGITAFGNLNTKRSIAGLNVSFYVGKLRR